MEKNRLLELFEKNQYNDFKYFMPFLVAGDPDILLVPDVSCGNILAKGLVHLAGARISGVVVGAKNPIALISRAERQETWRLSIALANVLA